MPLHKVLVKGKLIEMDIEAAKELMNTRLYLIDLKAAARNLLANHPCSDPDCCSTAMNKAEARKRLKAVLDRSPS